MSQLQRKSFEESRDSSTPEHELRARARPSSALDSRRRFLRLSGMLAAAAVLTPDIVRGRGWAAPAGSLGIDLVTDTFCGLAAFVVPGPDAYSVHQGESTDEPGGVDAFTPQAMIFALDTIQLAPPPFPSFSHLVAFLLNSVAEAVHPGAPGPFDSAFARLSFAEKVAVFSVLESDPALAALGGALPVFAAFTTYSEVGVFDPATRTLVGQPVGWAISGYGGTSDGRAEFRGYFQNRRKVD